VGEPVQLAEAAAPAPKQGVPSTKQQPQGQAQAQAPKPAQIDRNGVLILIRETLLALDQANKTGNYTVLRDLGSPEFQANTAARLAGNFHSAAQGQIGLSGVAVIDPQLTLLPQIEANGMMHMAGFFPSVPTQVDFDLRQSAGAGSRSVYRYRSARRRHRRRSHHPQILRSRQRPPNRPSDRQHRSSDTEVPRRLYRVFNLA
jgi:hypothetical protein